jgi:hypothetical protein
MYEIEGFDEILSGCLTLNYDEYIEQAVVELDRGVDFGIQVPPVDGDRPVPVIKLHGSFSWEDVWPIQPQATDRSLWIPPGIQKAKERYPFNMLWGRAREVLDCDVVRVIGCALGPNDWDLVSLLFSTRHVHASGKAYKIEIIDAPRQAESIKNRFPYLEVASILEVEPIGSQLIAELTGKGPKRFVELGDAERKRLVEETEPRNWFQLWLKHKAEALFAERGSVVTAKGLFHRFLEGYT